MSRTLLAIVAGLLCALAGMRYAAGLRAASQRMRRWLHLLRHLSLLLQEGTLSIPEAILAAADGHHPPDELLRQGAAAIAANPLMSTEEAVRPALLPLPEGDVLRRLFSRIDRGSKESRILALEQACDELTLLAQQASATAEKDAKLWQTLGLTGGICLTLLLL